MIDSKKGLTAASLTLAATALVSVAFMSYASAQCVECAEYPDRDPFTQGLVTRTEPRATVPSQVTRNAHAEMGSYPRGQHVGNPDHQHR